ncbi:hypothetical protein V3C99_007671 [Haemonchus contortus]
MMLLSIFYLIGTHLAISQDANVAKKKVVVGIAAAEHVMTSSIGWSLCGGAIGIALDKIKEEYDFSDFDFSFLVEYTECDKIKAVGVGIEFMKRKKVDVVIGPPCPNAGLIMAHLSNVFRVPWMAWGLASDRRYGEESKFPYVTTLTQPPQSIGFCALQVLASFGWDIVSVLYTENEIPYCSALMDSFVDAVSDPSNTFVPTIAVKQVLDPKNPVDYLRILQVVQQRSRVVIFCMDLPLDRRAFLAKASKAGMTTDEYVFIMFSTRSQGFGHTGTGKDVLSSGLTAFWEDTENKNADGLDSIAKQAAKRLIVLDIDATVSNQTYMTHFKTDVVRRVREDPLFCKTEECFTNGNKSRGTYARQLHDTFYMFGMGLSREPTYYHDATNITKAMAGDFSGLTGEVQMTENNTRIAVFMLYYLDSNFQQQVFMTLTYEDANINIILNSADPSTTIWATRNGKKPLTIPRCGFSMQECPREFWEIYAPYIGVGAAIVFILVICLVWFTCYMCRARQLEKQRLMNEWKIAHQRIVLMTEEKEGREKKSLHSLRSGPSTVTANSTYDRSNTIFTVAVFDNEPALITKHPTSFLSPVTQNECLKMRKLDHENVNKFLGFSYDGPDYMVVWKMCARGTLQAVFLKTSTSSDSFFTLCLIRDVAEVRGVILILDFISLLTNRFEISIEAKRQHLPIRRSSALVYLNALPIAS